jgi:hypothetical protein
MGLVLDFLDMFDLQESLASVTREISEGFEPHYGLELSLGEILHQRIFSSRATTGQSAFEGLSPIGRSEVALPSEILVKVPNPAEKRFQSPKGKQIKLEPLIEGMGGHSIDSPEPLIIRAARDWEQKKQTHVKPAAGRKPFESSGPRLANHLLPHPVHLRERAGATQEAPVDIENEAIVNWGPGNGGSNSESDETIEQFLAGLEQGEKEESSDDAQITLDKKTVPN